MSLAGVALGDSVLGGWFQTGDKRNIFTFYFFGPVSMTQWLRVWCCTRQIPGLITEDDV